MPVWRTSRRIGLLVLMGVLSAACARLEPGAAPPAPSVVTTTTSTTAPAPAQTTTSVVMATTTESTTTTLATTSLPEGVITPLVPEIVNRYPHDSAAFTQGLEILDGALLESLGEYGRSDRRLVDIASGTIRTHVPLTPELFGTGITVVGDRVIQLTWQSGTAIVADRQSLEEVGRFPYTGEGWGLCAEADRLIMSNGTDQLQFRHPETFEVIGTVAVTANGQPVTQINELECVNGTVWANLWMTTQIVGIDPASGSVIALVDASGLVPSEQALGPEDVLNGIAYNAEADTFYLTGKRWNVLYEVRLVPAG